MHITKVENAFRQLTDRQEKTLYSILLVVVCLAFSALYFNSVFPVSEGWNVLNAELILRGMTPYQDFYCYLPPLNLLIDIVLWKLSFGSLLVYRGWYLLQRMVILLLVFRLLCACYSNVSAFFSVAVTSFVASASVYDLFGDYNQTQVLLCVLLLFPAAAFVKAERTAEKQRYMFEAGLLMGVMFLNKQTVFAASVICYFSALVLYCLRTRDKGFWGYCGAGIAGTVVPILIALLCLLCAGALESFFDEVFFSIDSKGSLFSLFLGYLLNKLKDSWRLVIRGFAIVFVLMNLPPFSFRRLVTDGLQCARRAYSKLNHSYQVYIRVALLGVAVLLIVVLVFWLFDLGKMALAEFDFVRKTGVKVLWLLLLFVIPMIGRFMVLRKRGEGLLSRILLLISIAAPVICAALSAEISKSGYIWSVYVLIRNKWTTCVGFSCLLLLIVYLRRRNYYLYFFAVGAFSLFYAFVMSGGNTNLHLFANFLMLPLVLCELQRLDCRREGLKRLLTFSVFTVCTIVMVACIAQKRTEGYVWWGSGPALFEERSEPVEHPMLSGFRLPPGQAEMYEEVSRLIEANTDPEDEVWGYPHIRIFNVLTQRYNMHSFVPVLFFDVVADKYAEEAARLLEEEWPRLVLWMDLPNGKEVHEEFFRDGKPLKQREIEEFFAALIPEHYRLLGYYDGVEVYLLGRPNEAFVRGSMEGIIEVEESDVRSEDDDFKDSDAVYTVFNPLSFDTRVLLGFSMETGSNATAVSVYDQDELVGRFPLDSDGRFEFSLVLSSGETELRIKPEYISPADSENRQKTEILWESAVCE